MQNTIAKHVIRQFKRPDGGDKLVLTDEAWAALMKDLEFDEGLGFIYATAAGNEVSFSIMEPQKKNIMLQQRSFHLHMAEGSPLKSKK